MSSGRSLAGTVVAGKYRLLQEIGAGGMATVYKARHVGLDKLLALKVLRLNLADQEELVERFQREWRVASRLTSRHTVTVFDNGRAGSVIYIAMEYLRGVDLATFVREHGSLPVDQACTIASQVCLSLEEAHEAGIVHRDIKPENIFLCDVPGGETFAKVLDFGIAKLTCQGPADPATTVGAFLGTPYYMPPEQIRGGEVDGRADIYGLGATLYRVVTGHYPFTGDSAVSIVSKHLYEAPMPPSKVLAELPPELDRIILKAMEKRPERRYADALSMRRDLEEAQEGWRSAVTATLQDGAILRPAPQFTVEPEVRTVSEGVPPDPPWTADLHEHARVPAALHLTWDTRGEEIVTEERLSRSQWERFERRLKAGRRLFRLLPMVLLGLGAAFFYWAVVEGNWFASDVELEPNDDLARATRIFEGLEISGVLAWGGRGAPDRDCYRLHLGRRGQAEMEAWVEPVDGLNLVLEVYDQAGRLVMKQDTGGEGEGERVSAMRVVGKVVYLAVRPYWVMGGAPEEPASAPYRLAARLGQ